MKKGSILLCVLSLLVVACSSTAPNDNSSANKDPAQWQQYKAKKGVEELDANTRN